MFLIFPTLYDISDFISRADRRNRPGGLEDVQFWNFSTAGSQSIPIESQYNPLKIITNQWWRLLLRKSLFSQSSGNFRKIRDRILKALNALFKMVIKLWDSSRPFKSYSRFSEFSGISPWEHLRGGFSESAVLKFQNWTSSRPPDRFWRSARKMKAEIS